MWKIWVEFNLRPLEKCGLYRGDFHENRSDSTALSVDLLYQIAPKSDNKCGN